MEVFGPLRTQMQNHTKQRHRHTPGGQKRGFGRAQYVHGVVWVKYGHHAVRAANACVHVVTIHTQGKWCILGVRDTTPSWCVMRECGLEPLQFNWFRSMCLYNIFTQCKCESYMFKSWAQKAFYSGYDAFSGPEVLVRKAKGESKKVHSWDCWNILSEGREAIKTGFWFLFLSSHQEQFPEIHQYVCDNSS